ncbi:lytic transglycosylase domain-containing protein [Nocardioides terrisoli]|uniref:lytic transglycosylase domain-containing protein n=1 Tax=Nocardioides terrisoli TaxID=3388267 RepID=UPI00287B9401|nr:hypothetical protein [Nocardioides marmorisolisilvae]
MSPASLTRRSKAIAIVPVALLSGAWTVSLLSYSSAGAAPDHDKNLPDGTSVPSQAIQAPANVPLPGRIAPGVPEGSADQVVAGASTGGIPAPALAAYQRAAQIIDSADKACNIPWELIAAIGRVESDHGRYGGSTLNAKGIDTPPVYGPVLDGKHNTALIRDTDGGQIDGDKVFDRAVGPMQFIPSTWQVVKVDADGDGQRNPQDINDASLASAVYLCSGSENLATRKGQESAVYRYNHSRSYVNLVLRIAEAYTAGDFTSVPSGSYAGTVFSPSTSGAIAHRRHVAAERRSHGGSRTAPGHTGSTGSTGGTTTQPGTGNGGTGAGPGTGPSAPTPSAASNPLGALSDGVQQATSALPTPIQSALSPVTSTLTSLTALNFCTAQFAAIPDPLGLLKPLRSSCATQVQGMTQEQAASTIPNTLKGVLAWLSGK